MNVSATVYLSMIFAWLSHFNVNGRAGCLNYLLVGTELHRYHHRAGRAEAKNFSAVVSVRAPVKRSPR